MRWEAELKVGIMVVVAGALLAVLLTMASDWSLGTPGEELTIKFDSISQLMRGASVHISGVAVGKVTRIRLDESDRVEVRVRIDPPVELREGLTAELGTLGFVGETYISLDNGPQGNPPLDWSKPVQGKLGFDAAALLAKLETSMDELIGVASAVRGFVDENGVKITGTADSAQAFMEETTATLDELTAQVRRVLDSANTALAQVDRRLPALIDDTRGLIDSTRRDVAGARSDLNSVTSAAEEWVHEGREATRSLSSDGRVVLADVRESVETLTEAAMRLRADLTSVTTDAGKVLSSQKERMDESLAALDGALREARVVVARLDRIAEKVETGQGAFGQLMSDETLVPSVRETFASANRALSHLEGVSASVGELTAGRGPEAHVGVELTYRGQVRGLQPELGLWVSPSEGRALYGAISTRGQERRYSAVLSQRVGPVWARAGFIDSEPALGLDWQVHPRLVVRGEALRVTRPLLDARDDVTLPQLDAELNWTAFPRTQIILGAEDVGEDPGVVVGVRGGF